MPTPALASLYDVAVLGLMWGILKAYLHGAAMTAAAGVEAVAFTPTASWAIGTVNGWLVDYAKQIDDGIYPGTDSTLDTHLAAMACGMLRRARVSGQSEEAICAPAARCWTWSAGPRSCS